MKLSCFCVYDSAVGAHTSPQFFRSRGEAVRSFQSACEQEGSQFRAHAADYSFWLIGEFDDGDGTFVPQRPERVCCALDFVVKPS